MRKIEELKNIENKKYSVKQALAYYIVSFNEVKEKEFESLMKKLIETLIDIPDANKVLEQINTELLVKIENYWTLTLDQVTAYGCIVFHKLAFVKQQFSEIEILQEFIYAMRLYSPNNAEDLVDKILKK